MSGEEWRKRICTETGIGYSYGLAKRMEKYRTNPVLGYGTARSRAGFETGEMPVREMEPLGLSDVHKNRICVDSWEFEKTVMVLTNSRGREHWFQLGAYQTNFHTGGFREFSLVYLGKGAVTNYRQVDVTGKLVLADISQRDEWWINFPVYQTWLKGVAALIAVQERGYGETNNEAFNAQDIAGPDYVPAFSMSRAGALVSRASMGEDKQVQVRLSVLSTMFKGQGIHNIIGSIPGIEEGMVLLLAHYDSYFSGFQDDNAAVTTMPGIVRATLRSGYKLRKTLVFYAMAAEEWGMMNFKCDWSAGAYEQVFTARPDWVGKVIADLNFGLPAHAHGRKGAVRCAYEYTGFLGESMTGLSAGFFANQPYPEGMEVLSPIQTWSDDSSMAVGGIPSMVSDFSAGEFMKTHHHSQYDNENFYQESIHRFYHEIYADPVLALDRTATASVNFVRLFEDVTTSIGGSMCHGVDTDLPGLHLVLKQGIQTGEVLYSKIREINRAYGRFLDHGEEEKASLLAAGCKSLSRELLHIFKKEQDYSVRLSWHDDALFPQQVVQEDVRAMDRVVTCLENRNLPGALEATYTIGNNRYAFLSEGEVYTYSTEYVLKQSPGRLKWRAGRIVHHQNLFHLVERLKARTGEENPDTREEYDTLAGTRENQSGCHGDDIRYVISSAGKLLKATRQAGYRVSGLKHDLYTSESKMQEG